MVLSAAMLAGFLPRGLLGPVIGVYIDRYSRKAIMIISDLVIAGACLLLSIAGLFGQLPIGLIMAVLLVRSLGDSFHSPCMQAVTPQIVPQDQLVRCAGYSQSLQSVSQIASPAAAAVLYNSWSLNGVIFLDVLGALLAVAALCIAKIPPTPAKTQECAPHVWKEALEGFQILRANRGVMGLVLVSAVYALALAPTSALFPLMSMGYFGGTSFHASVAEVSFSIGLLLGSLFLSWWGGGKDKVQVIIFSFLLMGLSLICSGLLPQNGFLLFVVCSCLMGVSGPFYWGMYTPLMQQSFAQEYMGRVMALSGSIMVVASPVGLSLSGVFAEYYGVERWFFLAGLMTLAAALICMLHPDIRRCDTTRGNERKF